MVNLNFWSHAIFRSLPLLRKVHRSRKKITCEPDPSVVSFLSGLALMKTTVLESMHTHFIFQVGHPNNNCPGWRNGCNLLTYVIPRYLWWGLIYLICLPSLVYYAHVTVDSDKVCCVPWAVCSLLRLAPQWWINWLVTILTQCWCHIHTICKSDRERPGSIYHSNDINVYLGRQRGVVGSLTKRIIFHPEQAATFALYTFSTLVLGMILLERASKRVLVWKTPPLLSLCKMTLTPLEVLIPALLKSCKQLQRSHFCTHLCPLCIHPIW